jgi:uridine phosphorylase
VSRYLRPTATIAGVALLPSDPALAMRLAQELIASPRMSNHNHGLWGYSGRTVDGLELTVQSTGIGGPSAAAVLSELAALGVRRAFRIDTAVALDPRSVSTTIVVGEAICDDGASRAYGGAARIAADAALTKSLASATGVRPAPIASCDVELDPRSPHAERLQQAGAVAADLETAALLAAAEARGVEFGCAVVARSPADPGWEPLEDALFDLGRLCLGALARAEAAAQLR